jgi:ankyrin repeat protein
LLHSEYIEYMKRENKSNFVESKDYYIQRKLKRFIQINKKVLDKEKNNLIIVHSEEDFNLKCRENKNKESIHFLKLISNSPNLIWQKSRGPISDLKEFILKNEESYFTTREDKILDHDENILIISAEPGMGKSLILDKLVFESNSDIYCFKIILNNFTKILNCLNLGKQENILDFIFKSFLEKQNELNITLLKYLANKQKLILMFDGLDEVIDYKEKVKLLIKSLRDSCQFKMILITTRNHLRTELEDYFSTISFTLINIDAEEQITFLKNYWNNLNLKSNRFTRIEGLEHAAKDLVDKIRSNLNEKISKLIGIPLQTKMIADIYFEKLNSQEDFSKIELGNMADLYHEFIEKKIKIQFEDKDKIEIARVQNLFEEQRKKFYEDHIRLSSYVLLNKIESEILNINEIDEKRIIKFGLIVQFRNKIPIFLHQSYAEYFLAKNALNKMKQKQDDEEINQILKNEGFFLVRKFLNDVIAPLVINSSEKGKTNNNLHKKEIENCCVENLFNILNYLIENKAANIKTKNQFLLLASKNGHQDIVNLLLERGIDINQKDEDGRNALHLASWYGHQETVQLLIENRIDIKQTDEFGLNALHLASRYGHSVIVQILIKKGMDIRQKDSLFGQNALHWASEGGHGEIVQLLINEGIDINQTNEDGENAIRLAYEKGHNDIVKLLTSL